MMTKLCFLICVVSLLNVSAATAQQASATSPNVASNASSANATKTAAADIQGSPFLDDKFVEGEIYVSAKRTVVPVRYNVFQDWIEYQQGGQTLVLEPSKTIEKVKIGDAVLVVDKFELQGKSKYGYLTLLDTGKVVLMKKNVIRYIPLQKGRALDGTDLPAKYAKSPDVYFYKIGSGPLVEIDNLKSLIASFPDKQEELKQYAKKEKISVKKQEELIQFIRYYSSL
jgi:hypothetical protein